MSKGVCVCGGGVFFWGFRIVQLFRGLLECHTKVTWKMSKIWIRFDNSNKKEIWTICTRDRPGVHISWGKKTHYKHVSEFIKWVNEWVRRTERGRLCRWKRKDTQTLVADNPFTKLCQTFGLYLDFIVASVRLPSLDLVGTREGLARASFGAALRLERTLVRLELHDPIFLQAGNPASPPFPHAAFSSVVPSELVSLLLTLPSTCLPASISISGWLLLFWPSLAVNPTCSAISWMSAISTSFFLEREIASLTTICSWWVSVNCLQESK